MAKPRIIIADEDINYINPLQLRFIQEYSDGIEIEIICDADYFNTLFASPQKLDVLIVSRTMYQETLLRHNIPNVFMMVEKRSYETDDTPGVTKIFKYSNIKEIFNEIVGKSKLNLLTQKTSTSQIISICSATGGTGKTTIATAICASLAKNYKRVLYVNASYFQLFHTFLPGVEPYSDFGVCSQLMDDNQDAYQIMKPHIRNDGYDYVPPFKAPLASLGIPFSVFANLALGAKKSGNYDYIVVDSNAPFSEDEFRLLSIADRVIVVLNQYSMSLSATDAWTRNISDSASEKYIFICNNYVREEERTRQMEKDHLAFTINQNVWRIDKKEELSKDCLAKNNDIMKLALLL